MNWIRSGDLGTEGWEETIKKTLKSSRIDVREAAERLLETINVWNIRDTGEELELEEYEPEEEEEEEEEQVEVVEKEEKKEIVKKEEEKKDVRKEGGFNVFKWISFVLFLVVFWKYGVKWYKKARRYLGLE